MKNNCTVIIYDTNNQANLFNDITQCLVNIENAEIIEHDLTLKYCYERDYKRRWYLLFCRDFYGTYEEYEAIHKLSVIELQKNSRAYNRMYRLWDLVADALSKNLDIHLSLSDHTFINKCLTNETKTYIFNNASLY